jgi:hypothetical protein
MPRLLFRGRSPAMEDSYRPGDPWHGILPQNDIMIFFSIKMIKLQSKGECTPQKHLGA